jgi:hypothetical protein
MAIRKGVASRKFESFEQRPCGIEMNLINPNFRME